jgi:hypothetical protein
MTKVGRALAWPTTTILSIFFIGKFRIEAKREMRRKKMVYLLYKIHFQREETEG